MRRATHANPGFTLVELLVVVALASIFGGIAVVAIASAMTTARGDAAMAQVIGALRTGREAAIAQGRTVELRVDSPRRLRLVRIDPPDGETVLVGIGLENGARFQLDENVPDTPDAFGNAGAVDFGDAETLRFLPDSAFADESDVPVNGTLFVGVPGDRNSMRAVTITGASARAQGWRWTGSRWEEQ